MVQIRDTTSATKWLSHRKKKEREQYISGRKAKSRSGVLSETKQVTKYLRKNTKVSFLAQP
jgi:hypothetical protein